MYYEIGDPDCLADGIDTLNGGEGSYDFCGDCSDSGKSCTPPIECENGWPGNPHPYC